MSKSYVDEDLQAGLDKMELVKLEGCSGDFEAYRLQIPGYGRMQSCMILFTPEGIVLCGDWCPNDNQGLCSNYGYGLPWFVKKLGEQYLCEKFLRKEYRPEYARDYVVHRIEEINFDIADGHRDEEDVKEKLDDLRSALAADDGTSTEGEFFGTHESFSELMGKTEDWDALTDGVMMGYNPRDASLLCGLQQTFSKLYPALAESQQQQAKGMAS